MNWTKATDKQLHTIVKFDNDCPRPLLGGAVIEMLNRGMFDSIIGDCIKQIFKNINKLEQVHKVGLEDFMQIGRIEVLHAIKEYESSRGKNFISFVFLKVKSKFIKDIVALEAQKRDARKVSSYNIVTDEGTEIIELVEDNKLNTERYVINKVTLEQLLERVNKHQKTVMLYHLKGYTFREIAEILGRGSARSMHQAYRLGIEKMRKGA